MEKRLSLVLLSIVAGLAAAVAAPAATLPTGFAETQVATGLAAPTAMASSGSASRWTCPAR